MMLNSRQRAQLRGMANDFETILQVGKMGISENTIKQVDDALEARELIKMSVLLVALNSKFSHTNLAVRSISNYVKKNIPKSNIKFD